ncbi:hypothetical protein A9958_12860 (plasmid) [Staphylococcus simulans]|nr:hypothetical protein BI282_12800 [Staphylococcus simulans]AVO03338.1 hypothetical protein BI282_12855 [Staphylococcus simulans]AVO06398.1 hypothetical protein BI283_13520 [Staphylococcus simulans]AVO06409.1 hypothetical protein BI283_13575 [Staphylococcus simulans]AWG19875.1 hypothetical protein A9958_12805 [Staphylococcus simulans]
MNKSSNQIIVSYANYWRRALDISGRSTRSEFWHPYWINLVITSLLSILSAGTLGSLFALATLIPSFTVMTRRLHDSNRSMLFAILYHISGFITKAAMIFFVLGVIFASINFEDFSILGTTFVASTFGVVAAGLISLFILFLLVKTGNKKTNRYGSGGSCEISMQETTMNKVREREQDKSGYTNIDDIDWDKL